MTSILIIQYMGCKVPAHVCVTSIKETKPNSSAYRANESDNNRDPYGVLQCVRDRSCAVKRSALRFST